MLVKTKECVCCALCNRIHIHSIAYRIERSLISFVSLAAFFLAARRVARCSFRCSVCAAQRSFFILVHIIIVLCIHFI